MDPDSANHLPDSAIRGDANAGYVQYTDGWPIWCWQRGVWAVVNLLVTGGLVFYLTADGLLTAWGSKDWALLTVFAAVQFSWLIQFLYSSFRQTSVLITPRSLIRSVFPADLLFGPRLRVPLQSITQIAGTDYDASTVSSESSLVGQGFLIEAVLVDKTRILLFDNPFLDIGIPCKPTVSDRVSAGVQLAREMERTRTRLTATNLPG